MKRLLPWVLLVVVAACVGIGLRRVPEGSVAVRIQKGTSTGVWAPGWHWAIPGSSSLVLLPAAPDTLKFPGSVAPNYRLFDRDDREFPITVEVIYRVDPDSAERVFAEVGEGLRDSLIARLRAHARPAASALSIDDPQAGSRLAETLSARVAVDGLAYSVRSGSHRAADNAPRQTGVDLLIVGVDAGDWLNIDPLLAQGKLPHLRKLVDRGVRADLNSLQPMLSPLLWTTIATGTTPDRHGILDFLNIDPATGEQVPVTRNQRREPALWNYCTQYNLSVGVLGWLATWPAETVSGHMITDRFGFLAFAPGAGSGGDNGMTWPPEFAARARELETRVDDFTPEFLKRFVRVNDDALAGLGQGGFKREDRLGNFALTLTAAETHTRIAEDLQDRDDPRLLAVYYEMIDAVGHLVMPFAPPTDPNLDPELVAMFSGAMDAAYEYQDELLGRLLARAGDETVVMLISDHGFKSGNARPRGSAEIHGGEAARWHREPGILTFTGPGIRSDARLPQAVDLVDVLPTVLSILGLPIPESLDGDVLTEIFTDEGRERYAPYPVESVEWRPEVWAPPVFEGDASGGIAQANYHNNLGLVFETEGRLAEAEKEFRRALELLPRDRLARTNLAGILIKTQRLSDAQSLLQGVLTDFPDNTPAVFNLGIVFQRREQWRRAEDQYRRTLELDPAHVLAHVNLGHVLVRQGRLEEAGASFAEALNREPNDANAMFGVGLIAVQKNDLPAAADAFRRVLEMDPGHKTAAGNLQAIEKAMAGG